jgi:hypothetical protein
MSAPPRVGVIREVPDDRIQGSCTN